MEQEQQGKRNVMQVLRSRFDGWSNALTGLGTSRDKSTATLATKPRNSDSEEWAEYLYHGNDIAAKVCDIPAQEMTREWVAITAEQDEKEDPTNRQEQESNLQEIDIASQILDRLKAIGARNAFDDGITWARCYGGSLIFMGLDDGRSLDQPLNEEGIRSFEFLTIFDRHEIETNTIDKDPSSKNFRCPETYKVFPDGKAKRHQNGEIIHASRFVRLDGTRTSRRRKNEQDGWADSVFIRAEDVLKDFGVSWANVGILLQDFAQAVFKMKDLNEIIASDPSLVLQRLATMDKCRSVGRMIPIDSEMEDFQRTVTPLTGLPEILVQFAFRLAAAFNMPVSLLMGMSPAGLNATGEGDLTFWYNHVHALQNKHMRPGLERIIELIIKSGDFGAPKPSKWTMEFNPLWQLDDKEKAEVTKIYADADALMIDRGVYTEEEVAESRWGSGKFSPDIKLNRELRETDSLADDLREGEGEGEGDEEIVE